MYAGCLLFVIFVGCFVVLLFVVVVVVCGTGFQVWCCVGFLLFAFLFVYDGFSWFAVFGFC